jgi:hypothetical protein
VTAPAVDLDALARETIALGERATKGPWTITPNTHEDADPGEHFVRMGPPSEHGYWNHDSTILRLVAPMVMGEADAALIAAYRSSAPALATALLEAREAMREVLAMLGEPLHWHERVEKAAARLESALRSGAGEKETT